MSITHSLSQSVPWQDSRLYLEDKHIGMERRWKGGTQLQVKWAQFDSMGDESFSSDA